MPGEDSLWGNRSNPIDHELLYFGTHIADTEGLAEPSGLVPALREHISGGNITKRLVNTPYAENERLWHRGAHNMCILRNYFSADTDQRNIRPQTEACK